MAFKGLKIRVEGRVQGVFFRSNTREKATKLGLKGWVRNEADGNVLIVAEGEEDNLLKLIEWCKNGSELSRVDKLSFEWLNYTGDFTSFEIRH